MAVNLDLQISSENNKADISEYFMLENLNKKLCLHFLFEPPHDKTNKMTCAPSNDSDQPGHLPSLISLRCALYG